MDLEWPQETERILAALSHIDAVNLALTDSIRTARRAGMSWQQIASVLGTSKTAAWQRFHLLTESAESE